MVDLKGKLERIIDREKGNKENLENQENKSIIEKLEDSLNQINDVIAQQAQCFPVAFDCYTFKLPVQSVFGDSAPGIVEVFNDPFFLDCCINETEILADTPCGPLPVTVNEYELLVISLITFLSLYPRTFLMTVSQL